MLTIMTELIPITWSWAKYVLLLAIPIWVLSLWQIYKWPFIPRFYLNLCTKLRDFWRFAYILLSKRQILRIVHKDVSIRFNVRARTLDDVRKEFQAKDESLQSQIDELKEDKKEH